MHQMMPLNWFDATRFDAGCSFLQSQLAGLSNPVFDSRIVHTFENESALHLRCPIQTNETTILCVWDTMISHSHRIQASLYAAMHPSKRAIILNFRTQGIQTIHVTNPEGLLQRLMSE